VAGMGRNMSGASKTIGSRWYVRLLRGVIIVLALAGLAVFCYWAYTFTLAPVYDPHHWAIGNTHPGHTLQFYLDRPSIKDAIIQIGGNLVLLAPLGVLLPLITPKLRGPIRLTLVIAVISSAIEVTQGTAISGRSFDVDDIILNTLGGLLAYLIIGRRFGRLLHGAKR